MSAAIVSHLVVRPESEPDRDAWILKVRESGAEVRAICGHKWVPTRDPRKYPMCATCLEIAGIRIWEGKA